MLEVSCPHCGKTVSFERLDHIDASKQPEMIRKVRNNEAFLFSCGHCRYRTHMDYSFLYSEPSSLFMIYYAADQEDYGEAWKLLTGQSEKHGLDEEKLKGMKKRLVTSHEAFQEKLMIFDGGLDDRIIEIMKGIAYATLRQKQPELHPEKVRFDLGGDGNHYFRFEEQGKTVAAYAFERPMYEQIRTGLKEIVDRLSENQPVINAEWSAKALAEIQKI